MRSESSVPMSTDMPASPLEGIRLLVVDDSKINLLIAEKLLLLAGAFVHLAHDGCEALTWLKENSHDVDLVFLDVQMPVMDGLTAVGLIRSELNLPYLPVIAMTGADSNEEKAHALACGMTDHLIKPFNYKALVSVVLEYVPKKASLISPLVPSIGVSDSLSWPEIAGIDIQQARNVYMDDQQSFIKQLRRLLIEFEHLQKPLHLPVDRQSWLELAMQMHKLVGNAGLLAAPALAMAARRAELLAKAREEQEFSVALQDVAAQLLLLRQSALALVVKPLQPSLGTQVSEALDRTAVLTFIQELEDQNFSATKRFASLKNTLSGALDDELMAELIAAMDNLEFERALEIVKPLTDIK
jgi:CheY-like chemotaxis protein